MGVGGDEVEAADLFRFGDGRDLRRHCKWIYGFVSRKKICTCSWSRRWSGRWTDATEGGRAIEDVIVIEMKCDATGCSCCSPPHLSHLECGSSRRVSNQSILRAAPTLPSLPKASNTQAIQQLHVHSCSLILTVSHQSAFHARSKPIHNT
jgi:hypothetical protein